MNTLKFLTSLVFVSIFFVSCSNDDDSPEIVNEEEVITTMTITLSPIGGGDIVTLQTKDLDGDGGNDPIITPTQATLIAGKTYNGSIVLLNETEEPAENITLEVREEDDEHQFFFTTSSSLNVTTSYIDEDNDENGNRVGIDFELTATAASSGELTITLIHEPTKPNNGLVDAGGETDISTTFSLEVQ